MTNDAMKNGSVRVEEKVQKRRRFKGDGSVYQRSDGTWVAKYKPENYMKPIVKYAKSEPEAKRLLKAIKIDAIKNEPSEIKKMSVQSYMENWLYNVIFYEIKGKSFDTKENICLYHVFPYIGDYQIHNLKADDIQIQMINALVKKGLAFSTIKKAYEAVNACFKRGVIKGDMRTNPCIGVSLPTKLEKKVSDVHWFEEKEKDLICDTAVMKHGNGEPRYRLGQAIVLLMYTGMRISELLALKWTDINVDKKTVRIETKVTTVSLRDENNRKIKSDDKSVAKTVTEVQDGAKTETSERYVQLNKKALVAIEELRKLNGRYKYVMSSSNDKVVDRSNIDRMFRLILERCEIEPCGVHACRHTFASMLFKKGVDVKTVSELLGHKNVTITYNIYIHLINEQKQQAVDLLDDL